MKTFLEFINNQHLTLTGGVTFSFLKKTKAIWAFHASTNRISKIKSGNFHVGTEYQADDMANFQWNENFWTKKIFFYRCLVDLTKLAPTLFRDDPEKENCDALLAQGYTTVAYLNMVEGIDDPSGRGHGKNNSIVVLDPSAILKLEFLRSEDPPDDIGEYE